MPSLLFVCVCLGMIAHAVVFCVCASAWSRAVVGICLLVPQHGDLADCTLLDAARKDYRAEMLAWRVFAPPASTTEARLLKLVHLMERCLSVTPSYRPQVRVVVVGCVHSHYWLFVSLPRAP